MQELEKILKEIDKATDEYGMVDYINDEPVISKNRAKDIIRKHLSHENTTEITRSSQENDGWIPVEKALPEVSGKCWATVRYNDERLSEPVVVDFRGVPQKFVVDTPNGREYETWGIDSAFHGSRVIAWRPYYIPEPYRPERSRENEK